MRETLIEKKLRLGVEQIGGRAPKWVSPGNNGVQDRLVILPGGRTIYVETKAPGKPLAPLQAKWAEILRGMGHEVYKMDSIEDVNRFLKEIGGGAK